MSNTNTAITLQLHLPWHRTPMSNTNTAITLQLHLPCSFTSNSVLISCCPHTACLSLLKLVQCHIKSRHRDSSNIYSPFTWRSLRSNNSLTLEPRPSVIPSAISKCVLCWIFVKVCRGFLYEKKMLKEKCVLWKLALTSDFVGVKKVVPYCP